MMSPAETAALTRRERVRAATVDEIKRLAWAQIAEGGANALSLRSVAKDMGMTGSAIYRYYASRDDLLGALVTDGFTSLAEDLEAAERALPADLPAPERWLRIARAYRKWALGHRREYAVLFANAGAESKTGDEGRRQAHRRGVAVLFRVMAACVLEGNINLGGVERTLSPALRQQLEGWRREESIELPVAALAGCMTAWSLLHGMLSLELFGGFPRQIRPLDELFDQQMRSLFLRLAGGHDTANLPAGP